MDDGQRLSPETADRATEVVSAAGPLAALEGHLNRHPYRTVAAALGIGYVLGGGIFTPLTSRLLRLAVRIGIRTALLPVLTAELSELAGAFVGGDVADISDENEQGEQT